VLVDQSCLIMSSLCQKSFQAWCRAANLKLEAAGPYSEDCVTHKAQEHDQRDDADDPHDTAGERASTLSKNLWNVQAVVFNLVNKDEDKVNNESEHEPVKVNPEVGFMLVLHA